MLLRSVAQSFSILGTKWQAETMHSVLKRKERMTLTFFYLISLPNGVTTFANKFLMSVKS